MEISIETEILENYPEVEIGYLVAKVSVRKSDPFVESLKEELSAHLQNQGIDATNFVTHPCLSIWRKIYEEDFKVKAKTYRSSVESLVKRVLGGKGVWNIYNIVDLYNCQSVLSMLPMGGYDLGKISGNIQIRYAKDSEPFLALGERKSIETKSNHVIYSDDERAICWLWNHKDAAKTSINESSKYVIFFIDSFDLEQTQKALEQLVEKLEKIQCSSLEMGILSKTSPQATLKTNDF